MKALHIYYIFNIYQLKLPLTWCLIEIDLRRRFYFFNKFWKQIVVVLQLECYFLEIYPNNISNLKNK